MPDDKRPPKEWWDKCIKSVSKRPGVDDPESLCGYIYHHQMGPKRKKEIEKTRANRELKAVRSFWNKTCKRSVTTCMRIVGNFVSRPEHIASYIMDRFEGK